MSDDLMTSGEVAVALGVGASTVKRWTDTGELQCVKTLGKHRRFAKAEVDAFARRIREGQVASPSPLPVSRTAHEEGITNWLRLLTEPGPAYVVQAALLNERVALGAWYQVAAAVGAVLDSIATACSSGTISIAQQRVASERLQRGLTLVSESLTVRDNAPGCALVTGDDHTLGLALLELTLREAGWQPHWLGRCIPLSAIMDFIATTKVAMLALSSTSSDTAILSREVSDVGAACIEHHTHLVLVGSGAWPEPPPYGQRLRTFTGLRTLLDELKR